MRRQGFWSAWMAVALIGTVGCTKQSDGRCDLDSPCADPRLECDLSPPFPQEPGRCVLRSDGGSPDGGPDAAGPDSSGVDASSPMDGCVPTATCPAIAGCGMLNTGCGTVNCGTCTDPEFCGVAGLANRCARPASCKALMGMAPPVASGMRQIEPSDAPGGLIVYCDMDPLHAGGGWTEIFLGQMDTYNTRTLNYQVSSSALRTGATEALVGYRDVGSRALATGWAKFVMPTKWKLDSPFNYARESEPVQGLMVDGVVWAPTTQLVYGSDSWAGTAQGSGCDGAWTSGSEGRVCFFSTPLLPSPSAPFFSEWAMGRGNNCAQSNDVPITTMCTVSRRFSISIR